MYSVIMLFSGGKFSECVNSEFNIYGLECKMINYNYNLSYIFMYSIDMWINWIVCNRFIANRVKFGNIVYIRLYFIILSIEENFFKEVRDLLVKEKDFKVEGKDV